MKSKLSSEELWDIHDLLARYGHLIEAKDWSSLASLFTPDGRLDFTQMGIENIVSGRDNIEKLYTGLQHPPAHHCTNIEVLSTAADGQECSVRSKWFVPAEMGIRGGDYYDVLRRTEDGWLLHQRRGIRRYG